MPWSVAAAGIGAAGSIGGALIQSGNAGKANASAQRNLQLMLPQMQTNYNTAVQGYQPYAAAGGQALGAETDLLGLNGPDAANAAMANYRASPDYNYRLTEGLRAVDALGAAGRAMPGLRSGAVLKAEQAWGEGLAGQDFGNYFSRINSLAGTGLTAASDIAGAGNNLIAGMQGNATGQNALAIGGANAQNSILGNTTNSLGNIANTLFSDKNFQNWAGGLFGSGSGNLSSYGANPSDYVTAPGFNIGTQATDTAVYRG